MTALEINHADIQEFFEKTIPDQIHLTAIDPEKRRGPISRDFGIDVSAAVSWALERNAEGWNIHFTVNYVQSGVNSKPSKADIIGVRFAHLDVDPPKGELFTDEQRDIVFARLLNASPSTINWSGNGAQALWRLEDGVTAGAVEQINRGLIDGLGGDVSTSDVSRLLRVPGTVNWPDARKRALGRIPAASCIKMTDDGTVVDAKLLLARYPAPPLPDKVKAQPRDVLSL